MSNLWAEFNYRNATQNWNCGQEVVETRFSDRNELYHSCLREYGRCIGSVYVEKQGKPQRIGWIFQKRQKYDDCNETYIAETWVSILKSEPVVTIKREFMEF
jgi:hypothetical protein